MALDGHAAIGLAPLSKGQAIFAAGGRASIEVGNDGLTALVAYPAAAPVVPLLQRLAEPSAIPIQPAAPGATKLTGLAEASA